MLKSEALQIIANNIASCTKCEELTAFRAENNGKTVPGVGNPDARLMCVGEAPGKDESESGFPFVGKSGRLLTNILAAAGFSRDEIFIANILKCRPPGNRDPKPEEAANCRKYLDLQIQCVNPEWIVCFGRISSINLLGLPPDTKIGSLRGEIHEYRGRKVICSYHPAYLLRNPSAKEDVWKDLQPVIAALKGQS
jgi:DNA polymerase